jgi:DNA-directed RNA polymerase subunit beta
VVPQGRKITNSVYKEIQKAKIEQVEVAANDLEGAMWPPT